MKIRQFLNFITDHPKYQNVKFNDAWIIDYNEQMSIFIRN